MTESRLIEQPLTENIAEVSTWELEIQDILKQIEETFGGVKYVIQDGKIMRIVDKEFALINEKGLRYIKSRILILANKWVALSNLNDDEIRAFVYYFANAIRRELRMKHEEFGIKLENFETLVLALAQFIYAVLRKALNEGERKYRRGVERRFIELGGKKKGILESIVNLFKK